MVAAAPSGAAEANQVRLLWTSMSLDQGGMHLLALNLQRPTAVQCAVYGNFSGAKSHEIVVSRGHAIELFRPDETGHLVSICYTQVFATIRSLLPFRLAGANTDYLVIGSDSGTISISEYDNVANDWKLIHCEFFGKTGCRRIVPGQYLASDPKGRAIMIASIEKQKFVYIMNRDSANRLTISSPLEAHKSETIVFAVCGVDVGFSNPIFALIEMEYSEADKDTTGEGASESEKKLTYYELDLGLNHVVRKWSEPISTTSNLLFTVPGGTEGPSGVLICGENWISYKNQGHVEVRTPIPRRHDLPVNRGVLITCGWLNRNRNINFFYLLQSEYGDLYKVTLEISPENPSLVTNVIIVFFDTIPPANNICVTRTGLLFSGSEFGNHGVYQIHGLGDDPNAVRAERVADELNEELGDDSVSASRVAPTFTASGRLSNLLLLDDINSLAPITDLLVGDLAGEETPQMHLLCGRGNRSNLRVLRHGVGVTEVAVSELPGRPNAVWTLRGDQHSELDKYVVVSFNNATLVLSIGESVEEVTESGFNEKVPTLDVVLLDDNSMLQIHSTGIRHIKESGKSEWKTPGRKPIERASSNARQVAISLQGGEIIYFELDAAGNLMEMANHDMGREVSCLDVGEIPPGRLKAPFLAVGCWDDTVQLLSLDAANLLSTLSTKSLPSRPDAVLLVRMEREKGSSGGADAAPILYLNVGLSAGVLVRLAVDAVTGSLSDMRQRYLGPKSVKLFRVSVRGQSGVLALSSRPWLLYNFQGRHHQAPLSYERLEFASNFASSFCPEGIVAVAGNTLRIVTVDDLGAMFNQLSFPLRYTPRKTCILPDSSSGAHIVIIETDHNEFSEAERASISGPTLMDTGADGEDALILPVKGPMPAREGNWASCIRILHPSSGETKSILELGANEAAFSVCTCRFSTHPSETFLIVGTSRDLTLHPRRSTSNFVNVYRVLDFRLQLLHQTEVEDVPLALSEFGGRLLVGSGKSLKLFDLGKRKLLKKAENRTFPSAIVKILTSGDRIYVGDVCESVHFVKYKRQENVLGVFADDTAPRYRRLSFYNVVA